MADVRTNFPVLEDPSTQAGLPLHKVLEGDSSTGKNALASMVAADAAGNLKYMRVNQNNELVVSTESSISYALLSDSGSNAGSATYVDLVTIALQNDLVYRELEAIVSCFRDAVFQVVFIDDATETLLVPGIRAGAGDYNGPLSFKTLEFVAGATGTQQLVIRGKNINATSTLDAALTIKEIQA
jgi:hypothetical protein